MKRCYLDSNVLIYFKAENSSYHKKAVEILFSLVKSDIEIFISPLVLDEFIYVVKYQLELQKSGEVFSDLRKLLNEILNIPKIKIINPPADIIRQGDVLRYMQKYNLSCRDAYHLLTILENKIKHFATFDKDFKSVFSAKIVASAALHI